MNEESLLFAKVRVMCETRDLEHAVEMERVLKEHYKSVHFGHFADVTNSGGMKIDLLDCPSPFV